MPLDNALSDRLRDNLLTIMEIVEIKWKDLLNVNFIDELDIQMSSVTSLAIDALDSTMDEVSEIKSAFSNLVKQHYLKISETKQIEQNFNQELESLFDSMSLTKTFDKLEIALKKLQIFYKEKKEYQAKQYY